MRSYVLALVFLPGVLLGQEEEGWWSLGRLSVSATSSYSFAPWKDFNDSYQVLRDAVGYSPFYSNVTGHIQKIRGDMGFGLQAQYRLLGGLSAHLFGEYGGTRSDMQFDTGFLTSTSGASYHHKFDFRAISFGAGVSYETEITPWIRMRTFLEIGHATGTLDISYVNTNEPISKYEFIAPLSDRTTLIRGGYGVGVNLFGPVMLDIALAYRSLVFNDLKGRGTFTQQYYYSSFTDEYRSESDAVLAKGGGFFGAKFLDTMSMPVGQVYQFWSDGSMYSFISMLSPAALDLSGVSITASVRVNL